MFLAADFSFPFTLCIHYCCSFFLFPSLCNLLLLYCLVPLIWFLDAALLSFCVPPNAPYSNKLLFIPLFVFPSSAVFLFLSFCSHLLFVIPAATLTCSPLCIPCCYCLLAPVFCLHSLLLLVNISMFPAAALSSCSPLCVLSSCPVLFPVLFVFDATALSANKFLFPSFVHCFCSVFLFICTLCIPFCYCILFPLISLYSLLLLCLHVPPLFAFHAATLFYCPLLIVFPTAAISSGFPLHSLLLLWLLVPSFSLYSLLLHCLLVHPVVTLMKLLKLHYVCMSTDGMWIVLDSFLLHLSWACTVCQCTLCKVLNKESKRDGGAGIAVNMIPFTVLEIDPYLSIPCQVRSELSKKSMKRQLSILFCKM